MTQFEEKKSTDRGRQANHSQSAERPEQGRQFGYPNCQEFNQSLDKPYKTFDTDGKPGLSRLEMLQLPLETRETLGLPRKTLGRFLVDSMGHKLDPYLRPGCETTGTRPNEREVAQFVASLPQDRINELLFGELFIARRVIDVLRTQQISPKQIAIALSSGEENLRQIDKDLIKFYGSEKKAQETLNMQYGLASAEILGGLNNVRQVKEIMQELGRVNPTLHDAILEKQ